VIRPFIIEAAAKGSWGIMVKFEVMRQVRGEMRAIFDMVVHVNKKRVMNEYLNPFIRRFLVFEKYLLCLLCVTLFFLK
jgi:hypothetical protein